MDKKKEKSVKKEYVNLKLPEVKEKLKFNYKKKKIHHNNLPILLLVYHCRHFRKCLHRTPAPSLHKQVHQQKKEKRIMEYYNILNDSVMLKLG